MERKRRIAQRQKDAWIAYGQSPWFRAESERIREERRARTAANQAEVLHDLAAAGVHVDRIAQLQSPLSDAVVDVLLKHLGGPEDSTKTQREIVGALGYPGTPNRVRDRLL